MKAHGVKKSIYNPLPLQILLIKSQSKLVNYFKSLYDLRNHPQNFQPNQTPLLRMEYLAKLSKKTHPLKMRKTLSEEGQNTT